MQAELRAFAIAVLCLLTSLPVSAGPRDFSFRYSSTVEPLDQGASEMHIFVPLAVDNAQQQVLEETIEASIEGQIEIEDRYGNRYWHGVVKSGNTDEVSVEVQTRVRRFDAPRQEQAATTDSIELFLQANQLVPINHPVLSPIQAEIDAAVEDKSQSVYARAVYDWVVDNVEYKKVGTGWGNGDTFWACTERYGNCTDFHSLYIALVRSRSIPAKFEIGFPVPDDRESGVIGGYHCWVEVYLPEHGWLAIDASEAAKHPPLREFYYGSRPTNRIHFSTGRDLQLGGAQRSGALNYFIYPHVEVDGRASSDKVETSFSYES